MPIYEYECTCCQSRFELKRSFDEDTPVSCPQCECEVQRVFSPVPVIFKGSGFYVTDSRKDYGPPSGGDGSGETKAGDDKTKADSPKEKAGD